MELFEAKDFYIVQSGEHALWCNRLNGEMVAKRGEDICTAWNPICLGKVHGVIGKMKIHPDSDWQLLLIKQRDHVGTLPGGINAYKITRICVLPLSLEQPKELEIEMCHKHHFGISKSSHIVKTNENRALQATWNSIKSAAENVKPKKLFDPATWETYLPFKMPQLSDMMQQSQPLQREMKEREKLEKRILEELHKMFSDSDSFYYCDNGDLTSSLQRCQKNEHSSDNNVSPWKRVDDRFFWNKFMLGDLVDSDCELAGPWIVPVIQGYIQIETCTLNFNDHEWSNLPDSNSDESMTCQNVSYKLALISRRSRFRAGTRYKRRGVDEQGHCANYVETEQILEFRSHVVSFVQVRGSVPLYWSQTGIKYRPPPRIDKGPEENSDAFQQHFEQEISCYDQVAAISLVDQSGKEKVIADAFLRHVLTYNCPRLTYVAFDFHEYCRGMQFENVNILLENIQDVIKTIRYCWADKRGLICEQQGVFRVNCIDCLDRTNIVQSAIARTVLEVQCRKLGLLPPEEQLPPQARSIYQQMWANNGDTISRQYAGTAALKGDYTRTGERKLTGMMKDGVNSASRYYINRVKDVYRQATIDLMQGLLSHDDLQLMTTAKATDQPDSADAESQELLVEKEENLKTLIDECKKLLLPAQEVCLGGWGLIDCDSGDPTQQDMDVILLLTREAYYVANYDDDADQICSFQKIPLENLFRMEIGPLSSAFFKSSHLSMRICYRREGTEGYFHTFRATNTRLFNNIVIHIRNEEDAKESMKAIYESFSAAKELLNQNLDIIEKKLDRRKSKPHIEVIDIASKAQEQMDAASSPARGRKSGNASPSNNMLIPKVRSSTANILKAGAANIGRTLTGFNPIRKMTRNIKSERLTPTVVYSKDVDSESDEKGDCESVEAARILEGDKVADGLIHSPVVMRKSPERRNLTVRQLLGGDGSASESDLTCLTSINISAAAEDGVVLMREVGILTANPSQIQVALQRCKTSFNRLEDETSSMDAKCRKKKALVAMSGDSKSKSLDSSHRNAKLFSLWADQIPENNKNVMADFSVGADSGDELSDGETLGGNKAECMMTLQLPDTPRSGSVLSDVSPCDSVMSTPATKSKTAQLHHPCMKTSYSEGSISTNYMTDSYENISIDDMEDLDICPVPPPSALSRFKHKVSNLAVSSMPASPGAKRRAAEKMAKQKKIKSQLRFQECKTRILLL